MTQQERVHVLSSMENRDGSGRHFTDRYPMATIRTLEREGFLDIHRPIMPYRLGPMGPCRLDQWEVSITPGADDLMNAHPEWHDNS